MNKEIIIDRLKEIDDNLAILEKLAKHSREKFIAQPEIYKLAERCLQLAVDSVLDISHYILAQQNWPRAEGKEAIRSLGQYRVIPAEFAEQFSHVAGFRNILVHEYLKIDRNKVFDFLHNLQDFREFSRYVLGFLEDQ
ncbi:MAG: DUF86 domain-containing protein [Actinomycetia bacterium]|nr:DUF86 domain-containing protein [Actinomycetes bacterium]